MGRAAILGLLLLMGGCATWAASAGLGARPLDRAPEVRAGSVGGPVIIGRGPRSGK